MKSENNVKKMELRDLRLKLGLTQHEMAESLGMNSRYISMVESGLKPCSEKMLKKVELLFAAKHAQAPPGAEASLSRQTSHAPCPLCMDKAARIGELEGELKDARAVIRDQASAIAALAAKPTMFASAPPACGAAASAGKTEERKDA